jgi:hypothetical protein
LTETGKSTAGDGDPANRRLDSIGAAHQGKFDGRLARLVSGQAVGEPQRALVEGARHRHPEPLIAKAAEILDGGEGAGIDDK